jgi:adenylate kinase
VKPIYDAGELVPDDLMIELIRERLARDDTRDGFALDGFPRTMVQARALDGMLREIGRDLTVVFALQIADELCVERLLRRARDEGRTDDTPEAIRTRLAEYHAKTEPVIEHYRTRGHLVPIHGDRSIPEVFSEIQSALEHLAVRAGE